MTSLIDRTLASVLQFAFTQLSAYKYICIYNVQSRAERATHTGMKKIYNKPPRALGVSRPATSMVINLSEEKR